MKNILTSIRLISYVVFLLLLIACGSVAEELKLVWSKYVVWLCLGIWIFFIANYSKHAIEWQGRFLGKEQKLIWNGWLPLAAMGLSLFFLLFAMAIEGRSHGAI